MKRRVWIAIGVVWGLTAWGQPLRADVAAARAKLYADYASQLVQLADWCRGERLTAEVEQVEHWLPSRNSDQATLFVLPYTAVDAQATTAGSADFGERFQTLRNTQADALMALAAKALTEHRPSLCYELVTEAVRENPAHKAGRRMLGYVLYHDAWHTPFEIRQLGAGKVWHDKFGWLPKSHVERYESGQRYYQGRWMTAAEEAALRSDMKRGWRVESDHYVITTNHGLEAGVALARRLETLYAVWQQVFAGYVNSEADLARRLDGKTAKRDARQHNVLYYRTREQYTQALRAQQPKIDQTVGIYFDSSRTAHFFAAGEEESGTLFHEAAHQLFQETRVVAPEVARRDNFWIVEGIACYFETLHEYAGYCTLGGANEGRMPAARHRLLTDKVYVPLADLTQLGMEDLQQDPRIAMLYSQSAGLADFFMHDHGGRYREPLVRYLDAVYAGRATPQTLAEATGASYDALDRQYLEFQSSDAAP